MSKFMEYLQLIPKGIPHIQEIASALKNEVYLKYNKLPEEEKEEIVKRRIICETCPFNSKLAQSSQEYKELTGSNYKTERTDLHCSFCGCQIKTRTAGLQAECGASTWNLNNPEKHIPLKWTKYES